MSWGRQRRAFAAWLGLCALALQALVPLLVAAEISLAARSGDHDVFELCVFGQVHDSGHTDAPGKTDHDDGGTICPICVALHASPVYTAPAAPALLLPPPAAVVAAYRSRAPPLG